MTLTYTRDEQKKVHKYFNKKIMMACPFCGSYVPKYDFGGVFIFNSEGRPVHKTIECITSLYLYRYLEKQKRAKLCHQQ